VQGKSIDQAVVVESSIYIPREEYVEVEEISGGHVQTAMEEFEQYLNQEKDLDALKS